MTEAEFLEEMQTILDVEDVVDMDVNLEDFDTWDSLSFVSFLAAMSGQCAHRIEPKAVRAAKTVRELYALTQG
jgi:phosphopantetheine attachment domain protein